MENNNIDNNLGNNNYANIPIENNGQKNNTLKIIIAVVLIVLLVISGYTIYDKYFANKDNDTEESNNNRYEGYPEVSELDFDKLCTDEEKKSSCSKYLTLNETNIEIIASANEYYSDSGEYYFDTLKINEKTIFSEDSMSIMNLKAYSDLIIITFRPLACGGTSCEYNSIRIINQSGQEIVLPEGKSLTDHLQQGRNYEINGNKILFVESKVGYVADYGPGSAECYLKINDGIYIDGENYNTYANENAKIKYEVEYLGKEKFSKLNIKEEIKFGQLYTKEYCIEDARKVEEEFKEWE